jgi:hypothetical protein
VEEMASAIRRAAMISPEACRLEAQRRFNGQQMLSDYLGLYKTMAREAKTPELRAA